METENRPIRQSPPKSALERLYLIDQQIASGKYPNTSYLVEYVKEEWGKITTSTISRDIAYMKDRLHAPIEYNALQRGYYYSEPHFRIPLGFSGAEELLALGMAKGILSLFQETPLYESAVRLMESITAPLAGEGNRDWFENRIVVPKIAAAKVEPAIWNTIIAGLKENRILTFKYLGKRDEDYQNRMVRPYQLLFDSGVWFLYGFSEERRALRIFSLSRIKDAALSKVRFSLPPNYSYTNLTGDSYFGIFIGMKKHHFSIDCFDDAAIYAAERRWAKDQKIIKRNKGITMEFTSTQYEKVLQWVLSCGCCAIPRKPKMLVDHWKWHVHEMNNHA